MYTTMSKPGEKRMRILRLIGFALCCALLYHVLTERKATVRLEMRTLVPTVCKLYWQTKDAGYWNEDNVHRVKLTPEKTQYSFKFINLADITALRIDPGESPTAKATIRSITITQNGYAPIRLAGSGLTGLVRGDGIASMLITDDGLEVTPADNDPQLFFDLPGARHRIAFWGGEFFPLTLVFVFAFLAGLALERALERGIGIVPLCLAVILVLIASMATISRFGAHPDEGVHARAGDYYQDHFLPPEVGADGIRDTYSVYGVSRLHSGEAAYFFLGKFVRIFHALTLPSYMTQRYFNVALWAVLLILALAYEDFRLLMAPALLSPQVWYIFSYVNSEAFACFVMLLAAWQVAAPNSTWNRLLDGGAEAGWGGRLAVLWLGLLFGFLLLLKKNFYFFLLFLGGYFLWRLLFGHTRLNRSNWRRVGAVLCIGFFLFGAARYVDSWVNDFHKGEKVILAGYRYAAPLWNPGTPPEKRHPYLQMRDRGVTLRHLLTKDRWAAKSFQSAFGVYGLTSVSASPHYYRWVRNVGLCFLAFATCIVLVYGGWEGITLWLMILGMGGTLVGMSLYQSWTVDFQAQGRYFLPIVGMLAVFTLQSRQYLFRPIVPFFWAGMFLFSLYSFVCVGLAGILKIL